MNKIPSFEKNHDTLQPGLHLSTRIAGVTTYDLRFKKPNAGNYISDKALHSIEHMLATILRNGAYQDKIIYFGPMGCRTGFYLLTIDLSYIDVLSMLREAFTKSLSLTEVPGAKREECGNYLDHDLASAQTECRAYLDILQNIPEDEILLEQQKENHD